MAVNVLHFIETLGRGGAEVLFTEYINALPKDYNSIVVYMHAPHVLKDELQNVTAIYCLNYSGKADILRCAYQLTKICRHHEIDLIHSHLYWPAVIARLSVRIRKVPLLFHVHSLISEDAFKPNILSKYLEKLTYSGNQMAVFVSETVMHDYQQHIKTSDNTAILYNFVRDAFFSSDAEKKGRTSANELKLVSVGNLRPQKNQLFLIKCLQQLKQYNITLDIYGEGAYKQELEAYLLRHKIENVRLLGSHANIHEVLKDYDVFVMASAYEGFCIALAEAMAVGLPCLVPDAAIWKEISENSQLYYKPNHEGSFVNHLLYLQQNPGKLETYATVAKMVAAKYRKQGYLDQLTQLYGKVITQNG